MVKTIVDSTEFNYDSLSIGTVVFIDDLMHQLVIDVYLGNNRVLRQYSNCMFVFKQLKYDTILFGDVICSI